MANIPSDYDYASIFRQYVDEDNQEFYNLYNNINMTDDMDSALYTEYFYNSDDTWYQLSFKFYGDIRFWWLILVANQIQNPFEILPAGTRLKIPIPQIISNILGQIRLSNI